MSRWEKKIHNRSNKLWTAYFVMHQQIDRMTGKKKTMPFFRPFFPDKNVSKFAYIARHHSLHNGFFTWIFIHWFFFVFLMHSNRLINFLCGWYEKKERIIVNEWEQRTKVIKVMIKMVGSLLFQRFSIWRIRTRLTTIDELMSEFSSRNRLSGKTQRNI